MSSPGAAKKVHIATFGCQMNRYDSDRLAELLAAHGYSLSEDPAGADLIILNTCSVRERAAQKVYSQLGVLKSLKRRRPGLIIGVGGCLAQQEGARLLENVPHLDLVFGTDALEDVPALVDEAVRGRRRVHTPRPRRASLARTSVAGPGELKALVTVMQGCDNYCAYCVVPYVRGPERSRPAGEILEEVAARVEVGAREVTLLGQNVNSYRDPGGVDFPELLRRVAAVPGLWRVRFTTSHPKDLSPRLIETMAGEERVMEQLHLPAQAGSDRVLAAMRRGYTCEQYLAKVRAFRRAIPQGALGGDIIVGFPGESEEDFAQTMRLLEEVRYDFLFSFKYSDRPRTVARRLKGKLPEEVKARRLKELQARQRQITLAIHQALEGSVQEVLVEGPAKRGQGLMTGRSRAGRAVNFPGGEELVGRLVRVRIDQGRVNSLLGQVVADTTREV